MAIAIWKDTEYVYTGATGQTPSPIEYSIKLDGNSIFNGKAWAAPNSNQINININRVAQDYLSVSLPDLRSISTTTNYTHSDACKTFGLYSGSSLLQNYTFVMDWSYNDLNYSSSQVLSRPVNNRVATNMMGFTTNWNGSNVITTINPSPVANCCDKWALYYLNRYGGWDALAIEGKVIKKDSYERYFIDKHYDNSSIDFGKKVYNNQITESWEIHTGWFNDRESELVATHLLASNQVYLHDLVSGQIIPVIVTDASAEYKTWKNQNYKMHNYTINVEGSQTKQNLG